MNFKIFSKLKETLIIGPLSKFYFLTCKKQHGVSTPTPHIIISRESLNTNFSIKSFNGYTCICVQKEFDCVYISYFESYYLYFFNLPYRVIGPCRLSISVNVSILQDSCKILIYSRFCF